MMKTRAVAAIYWLVVLAWIGIAGHVTWSAAWTVHESGGSTPYLFMILAVGVLCASQAPVVATRVKRWTATRAA